MCDRARVDVSNIPSDKVSVLHLKLTNANLLSIQVSRVFPSVLMVRESVSSVSGVSDNSSEKWLGRVIGSVVNDPSDPE